MKARSGPAMSCWASPGLSWFRSCNINYILANLNPIMSSNFLFNIKWLNDLFGGAAMSLVIVMLIVLCLNDLFGGAAMSMTLRDCDVRNFRPQLVVQLVVQCGFSSAVWSTHASREMPSTNLQLVCFGKIFLAFEIWQLLSSTEFSKPSHVEKMSWWLLQPEWLTWVINLTFKLSG